MPFLINECEVTLKVDSGADVNVIGHDDWLKISAEGSAELTDATTHELRDYNGNKIETLGSCEAEIRCPKSAESLLADFFVTKRRPQPVLSFATAQDLGILKLNHSVQQITLKANMAFPSMPIAPVKLRIDKEVIPKSHVYNNIPASLEKFVEDHWDGLEARGIIEPLVGPTTWLSSVHVVPKKGNEYRVIIDMRIANTAIAREYYPMPNPEKLLVAVIGAIFFTILDFSSAYHHVMLHKESRHVTAFMTARGPRQFTRLPFGINCAPEIFQRIMDDMLRGLSGVVCYLDDILVYGKDLEELRQRTDEVWKRIKANNLTLNEKKCKFEQTEVEFIGSVISKDGIRPTKERISGITDFPRPKTYKELRGFIGLVNYIASHLPGISTTMAPMRELLKGNSKKQKGRDPLPQWTPEQHQSFEDTKRAAAKAILRGHYDLNDKIAIKTDASPVGLGAMTLQRDKNTKKIRVIACASRSLTETEQRYPQTQREALAIVWGIEKFYYYLAGREFTVITDHKPMQFIFGNVDIKSSKRAMTRSEAWAARLGQFDFAVKVIAGKENEADILSRMPGPETPSIENCEDDEVGGGYHYIDEVGAGAILVAPHQLVTVNLTLSYESLRRETRNDPKLQAVIRAINGEKNWDAETKGFTHLRDEMRYIDGVVMRDARIVIPEKLQRSVIATAHRAHPGMSITKNQLRRSVWWPGMDRAVEDFIKSCLVCIQLSKCDAPEPLVMSKYPERPWENVAIDFWSSGAMNEHILVLVDYYSKAIQAAAMNETNTPATIKALERIFHKLGWVTSIKHDNGPQFISNEFKTWMENNRIASHPTTPRNAQENGLVERQMAGIGRAMKIAKLEKKKFTQALEDYVDAYNSWPHSVTGIPPRDLLYGRVVRGELPASEKLFNKYPIMESVARERNEEFKESKKEKTDLKRGAKQSTLAVGDWVHVKLDSQPNKLAPNFSAEAFEIIEKEGGRLTLIVNGKKRIRKTTDVKLKRQGEHLGTGVPDTAKSDQRGSCTTTHNQNTGPKPVTPPKMQAELRRSSRQRFPPASRDIMMVGSQTNSQRQKGKHGRRTKTINQGSHCRSCGRSNEDETHKRPSGLSTCKAPTTDKRCFQCGATGHFAYRCNKLAKTQEQL